MLIPVPSRLYSPQSDTKLAGLRVSVKDIFDIKGLITTAGRRVFSAWKDKAMDTADCLRILEDAGVAIVGKVKTSQIRHRRINKASELGFMEGNILGDDEIPKAIEASLPLAHRVREAFKVVQNQKWGNKEFDAAKRRFNEDGNWFLKLLRDNAENEMNSIMYAELTALDWIPIYREKRLNDIARAIAKRTSPLGPYIPASVGGCPHFIMPIGQTAFQSPVSHTRTMAKGLRKSSRTTKL
ncbi:uncharacterized protein IL334_003204 [Kwoniella shivajii]|uniref:Amidase domain-containing protein n=1 Tax=Kwoniella shivajii TaxID=564305 RepID=A0ABZ1CWW6_9TREE|nr:hypothetical protein IL334_003204 [Kwoniella shivajii]